MSPLQTVLLVGGTGRTGKRVLEQLIDRGIHVRAIVRSANRLPNSAINQPNLTIVEANLLSMTDEALAVQLLGCDAAISCLGHTISFKGVFGPPRNLVTQAVSRLCRNILTLRPDNPVKFVLMGSVSINSSGQLDPRRSRFELGFLSLLRALVPPTRDSQSAADYLLCEIGEENPFVRWVVVRPDTLQEGGLSKYSVHDGLLNTLFAAGKTNRANVAHFMCDLVSNKHVWEKWESKFPVIVNSSDDKDKT